MRARRRLRHLNDAIEALDQVLRRAKGDPLLAFSQLSPTELQFVREEISSCVSSRTYYLENYHIIQTEAGELKGMFPLWDHQWMIENAIQAERERTAALNGVGSSKTIVLKPRQTGGTEYANGVMCHCTFFTPQAYTLTVAQDLGTAAHVQRKVTTAWDNLPWWLRPEKQYHTKGEHLEFQRTDEYQRQMNPGLGSVFVTTHAERNAGVAIGRTIRFFHGTEVSRWGSGEIFTADIEPSMNAPDTLAIMESASLDDQGFFVNLWNEASEDPDSEWVPVFLPVYRARKYSWPRWPARLAKPLSPPLTEAELSARERVLREEKFLIPDEFFNWRRIRTKLAIKRDGNPYAYYAAYPMTPKEAFQSAGIGAFPRHKLDWQEQTQVVRPRSIGEIFFQGIGAAPKLILEHTSPPNAPPLIPPKRGDLGTSRLWVWEEPDPTQNYYIGADTSLGNGGNYSAAPVWRAGSGAQPDIQVAEWHGWIPPTDWAKTLYALGWWYNRAEIAVEYAAEGMTTANYLFQDLEYPNIYRPRFRDRPGAKPAAYMHWQTTMKTKPLIIAQMVEALLEDSILIRSQLLLDELRKFRQASISDSGHVSYSGLDSPDDCAMAAMIGLFCLRETMPELRSPGYSDDASQNSPSRGARASGGAVVYAIHDEWTRMRGQTSDLARAQKLVRENPGWMIKPVVVSRANTAYSEIHHGKGAANEMWRAGIDSKEILPGAIAAWRGARLPEESYSEADELNAVASGGSWETWE